MKALACWCLPFLVTLSFGCSDAESGTPSARVGTGGSASSASGGGKAVGSGGAVGSSGGAKNQTGGAPVQGNPTGQGGGGSVGLDGKALYDNNCRACHGEQGIGGPLGPEVQHPVREYSSWVVRNGRAQTTFPAPMDKFGTGMITDAQLALIWDYLDLPPQPTSAQALYVDYCANCHGADGRGGPVTRPLANEAQKVVELVRNGKSIGQYGMRHDSMPAFTTQRLSDAELNLIRDYVATFN